MYKGLLARAAGKSKPGAKKYVWVEDNAPTGYKSRVAEAGGKEKRITTLQFLKWSLELNPLHFNFWARLARRMRRQEAVCKDAKREARAQILRPLKRAATILEGWV